MAFYKKKPVVIEAFRWPGGESVTHYPLWFGEGIKAEKVWFIHGINDSSVSLVIKTLEGPLTAKIGDWIIKGIQGELYPCKPDIFEATYEEVK